MTDTPDLPGEMIRMLDDDTVEAILAGDATGSVPAEYARVAQLARAARVDAACDDPAGSEQREAEVVAAIATAMRQGISWNSTDASSASAADAAPPEVTPASDAANSAHDHDPGDTASEAHSDNPSSEDDTHAQSGSDHSTDASTESDHADSRDASTHSQLDQSSHSAP